ncbi:MAG: 50S ribosomal protein L25 [Candidatus Omnitrophota bacterium]
MEQIILNALIREKTGKSANKKLRHKDVIPAVVYKRGKKAISMSVDESGLLHALHTSAGENAIITLMISSSSDKKAKSAKENDTKTVIIKEIQYHPVHENILHIDFQEISLTERIKVNVPIVLKGESAGVKIEGGILDQVTKELVIECLPAQIPSKIDFNIEALKIGDIVHVKELVIPDGIKVLTDPEQAVVSVSPPKAEEAPAAAEGLEAGAQEPEVLTERKPAEEEEKEEGQPEDKGKGKDKDKDKDKPH